MTTYSLYGYDGGQIVPIVTDGSGGGGSVSVTRVKTTLESSLVAGTAFAVPAHTVGSGRILVHLNGLLCAEGSTEQYVDASSTTITFNDDLPAESEIDVVVFSGADTTNEDTSALLSSVTSLTSSLNQKLDKTTYETEKQDAYDSIGEEETTSTETTES